MTYVKKNSDGAFVAELMPSEYIVTFTHPEQLEKIGVIENRGPLAVEIATLTAEPGKVAVPKLPDPVAVIGGLSEMPSEKQYITVQRSVAAPFYLDLSSSVVVDVVRPAKGGFFLTKRLPVGRYIVKLQATDRQPIVPIAAWCVQIESDSKSINLSRLPAPDTLREKIETLLVARGTYSGIHHQIFDLPPNLEAVIHTLRSMAADQNSPWQRKALQLLCEDCEDSIVLAEQLLKLLPDVPLSYQSEIVNRLADFSVEVAPLVELLASLTATKNVLVRSHVFTAMTRLALGNPDQADRITKIFETAIKSSDRQSRIAAALCLGRLREKASLPVLNELREEDIEAAFLVWQLDGDSAAFFEIANRFLERKGLFWQRRACVFIAKVTQQEPVPASTHRLLNTLSDRPIDIHPSPYYNVCLQEIAQQAQKILAKSNPSDP
ncbi:hypothetical protein Fuma_02127 [Fuerstiella marisgermanici]|uniref:HEAT repeat domain-containing protein n=1 Tax=Fuerstiella marisgermanici TaxID=1891926 RepID=A0A1P8WEL5_9PLAN|nr:hypothetical protein Fuma_02127 [Fuerstiella marisgermanici]